MNTMEKVYQDAQAACGLNVGDYVRVTRTANTREAGWAGFWASNMDDTVGQVGVVLLRHHGGVFVHILNESKHAYPYFVLEKVDKPEHEFKSAHEFKPFDKVLVRNSDRGRWRCDFFSYMRDDGVYICVGSAWRQCIPYEPNDYLLSVMG